MFVCLYDSIRGCKGLLEATNPFPSNDQAALGMLVMHMLYSDMCHSLSLI